MVQAVKDAFDAIGESPGQVAGSVLSRAGKIAGGAAIGGITSGPFAPFGAIAGAGAGMGSELRSDTYGLMKTLWANFSCQRDFEIFKRNIYPGNGTGIAQFLGGDLGDGWNTIASITPEDKPNERLNYIGKVTDVAWNNLTASYGQGNADAKSIVDQYQLGKEVKTRTGSLSRQLLSGALVGVGAAAIGLGAPAAGTIVGGAGLLGVLSGRGGDSLFNAMGITSNLDDDLPGLDEVSFRAQTYMRSVWDMFQMCARLLPNYIVAVRPFEDRSTIFYGKPHWLYTSGVVPLTAGYASLERSQQEGIDAPKIVEIETTVNEAMAKINATSNPFADSEAFGKANNSLMSMSQTLDEQLGSYKTGSIYTDSSRFRGKLIAFGYKNTMEYRNDEGKTIAVLPASSGYLTAGYHLPIKADALGESELKNQTSIHKQIPQLPSRYRFPFFTDRKDNIGLEDFAYYALSDSLGTWSGMKADYMTLVVDKWNYNGQGGNKVETNWVKLLKQDVKTADSKNTVDYANLLNENGLQLSIKINTSGIASFAGDADQDAGNYIYSERTKDSTTIIRMPYPDDLGSVVSNATKRATEYQILARNPNYEKNIASIRQWGSPETPEHEQFYIAMRWPFKLDEASLNSLDQASLDSFYEAHGIDKSKAAGTIEDYKKMNVLVYSPTTGKAVVCKPAYFLWGEDTVRVLGSEFDENGNATSISTDRTARRYCSWSSRRCCK